MYEVELNESISFACITDVISYKKQAQKWKFSPMIVFNMKIDVSLDFILLSISVKQIKHSGKNAEVK